MTGEKGKGVMKNGRRGEKERELERKEKEMRLGPRSATKFLTLLKSEITLPIS